LKTKRNIIIFAAVIIAVFLSQTVVQASVDGMIGISSVEDKAIIVGTVTKDIPNPSSIFYDTYGDSGSYTLPFSLLSGEIYDSDSTATYPNYGNVTFNPAEATHSLYNASGLLDPLDYTEEDTNNVMTVYTDVETADVSNAPHAMRIYVSSATGTTGSARLANSLGATINTEKYFNLGLYVNLESFNATSTCLEVRLVDTSSNVITFKLVEGATDWSTGSDSSTIEYVQFDDEPGDVIFISAQLSEIDSWTSAFTLSSIQTVQIQFNRASSAWSGTVSVDIFCLSFTDVPLKAGLDRGDQVSSANDYVALNVSNPSSPNLHVREIDSHISRINDATIDFVYIPTVNTITWHPTAKSADFDWEIQVDTETNWMDEVSFGTMTLYYVLGASYESYTKFQYGGTDKIDILVNEEEGDAITLDSSIAQDTVYLLKVSRTYTDAEWKEVYISNFFGDVGAFFTTAGTYIATNSLWFIGGTLLLIAAIIVYRNKRK